MMRWMLCLLAGLVFLAGCGEAETSGAAGRGDELRIVSLSPALTQMVVDLGLGDHLVGTGEHDMAAPAGLPVVGHYADVRSELLLAAGPTHVLTMAPSTGVPGRLRELADAGLFELAVYESPMSVSEVLAILADGGDPPAVGEVLGRPERAQRLRARIERQLKAIGEVTSRAEPTRALLLMSVQPVTALGPGTTHDEMLALAGGKNAAGEVSTVTAPSFDRETLLKLEPGRLLLLMPGVESLSPGEPPLSEVRALLPGVERERVRLINDPLTLLPSSSLPRVVGEMARALHPELAAEVDAVLEAEASGGGR
ncbi:MAG: ABC transporter substrate-binding protein [Phycisphaeraceae bacterium]